MPQFALLKNGAFAEVRDYAEQPADIPHKAVTWLPYVTEAVDSSTGPDKVFSTAAPVVEAERVVVVTTIRDMTAQEISTRKDGELDASKALKVLLIVLWHTNKGTVPASALVSPSAFRTWVKSLYNGA